MRFTAIIPARSGSKRVPNKNFRPLAGKPLMAWTIGACLGSHHISRVVISTDSEEYFKNIMIEFEDDRLELDLRTPEDAGDEVKIFDYIHTNRKRLFSAADEAFVLALPTSPFRGTHEIDTAIGKFLELDKPLFSVSPYDFPIQFALRRTLSGWSPFLKDSPLENGNTRSQDQEEYFHPNGALYIRRVADLNNIDSFFQNAIPYELDRFASFDIDTEDDFRLAEAWAQYAGATQA